MFLYTVFLFFIFNPSTNKNGGRTVSLSVSFFPKPVRVLFVNRIDKIKPYVGSKFDVLKICFVSFFLISNGKLTKISPTPNLLKNSLRCCMLSGCTFYASPLDIYIRVKAYNLIDQILVVGNPRCTKIPMNLYT